MSVLTIINTEELMFIVNLYKRKHQKMTKSTSHNKIYKKQVHPIPVQSSLIKIKKNQKP